jgi:hypothetical protein
MIHHVSRLAGPDYSAGQRESLGCAQIDYLIVEPELVSRDTLESVELRLLLMVIRSKDAQPLNRHGYSGSGSEKRPKECAVACDRVSARRGF